MNIKPGVIKAIVKKDLIGLLPLVLLASAVFLIQPVIINLNLEEMTSDSEFWLNLQANFYWVGFFLGTLLMISVLQQDPAVSLNHDWLTRPISRVDWLLAKLLFLALTVCLPVVLSRFLINLGNDYGIGLSLGYALAIEKLPAAMVMPLLFAIALLTPNLRKSIFLTVLVTFVFLMPAWSVTRPLLTMIGIDLEAEFDGMMWLQALPVTAAGLLGAVLVYWFLYSRRERKPAMLAFWASILVVFFTVYPPVSVYNWDSAIAIHRGMINDTEEVITGAVENGLYNSLDEAVVLEHARACFPAAIADSNPGMSQDPLLVQAAWPEPWLKQAGTGAMTLATTVRSRNTLVEWFSPSTSSRDVGVNWLIDRIRTRAYFTADSLPAEIELLRSPTALNRFAQISAIDTDYWLIPGEAVGKLKSDPSTRLTVEYDLALLAPQSHELKTDGQRREFPGLGSCKAEIDSNANAIKVDCIKRGARPALISAALIGLDSSRVDNRDSASFTADWLESLGRSHIELVLESPNLTDSSAVMVTAYHAERIIHKQLVSDGLLGKPNEICPLPSDSLYAEIERSSWSDKSPHETSSVAVERGVRVEVLDWRGGEQKDAPTLFLLPGLGATVHSFDDVAPKLAEKYNVVGMTRRGAGDSSKPDHGYDIARLSQDVLQVLETLEIESPILVGMSIASEELNYLGANHPEKFRGLVYLDAAYDRTKPADKRYSQLVRFLPEAPPVMPAEAVSYETFIQFAERRGRQRNIAEGEIIASYDLETGTLKHDSLYLDAVMMGLQTPEYARIPLPALGIYALPGSAEFLMEPWYDQDDPKVQAVVEEIFQLERASKMAEIQRFDNELPDSEVLILEDAYHWLFIAHEQEVIDAIESFVDNL